ncbi:hypothetical protein AB3R30_00650 [Leptolyngbyaceae cyanobacterium UHCC 1019]
MLSILKFCIPLRLIGLSLISLAAIAASPVYAQQIKQATLVEILDGDQVFIQDRKASVNQVANLGEQVRTQQARAGLRFNVGAGIRLGRNSSVVVGGGCIRLNRGQVLVAGSTAGNRGCLRSVVAATRGTVYIMELEDSGQGRITVLEGAIEVSNPERPDTQRVVLTAGQAVDTAINGDVGAAFQVPQDQLNKLAAPLLEGFQQTLPDLQKIAIARRERGFTDTFLQEAIGGGDSFNRDFEPQKGRESIDFAGDPVFGTFVRNTLNQNTGTFTPTGTTLQIPISVNFGNRTLAIGEFSGVVSSLGLSGNNATGTVILNTVQTLTIPGTSVSQTGQAVRIEVFNVGFEEPKPGQIYPGSLSIGRIRDR